MNNKSGWYRINGHFVSELYEASEKTPIEKVFSNSLDLMAFQIRELVKSHQSAVSYVPDGDFTKARHATSFTDKYAKYRDYDVLPTGKGIWSMVFDSKTSICLTQKQLYNHPRFKNFSQCLTSGGLEHPPLPGWLAVPVINNDGLVVGLLQLSDKFEGEYTIDDVEALEFYAQIVSAVFDVQFRKDEILQKNMEITSLDRLAHQDYLTGEHNRLSFDKKLSEVLAKPLRKNDKVTLFLLDLDSFKSVNDTMGHTVGDELLKEVSKRVKSHIRDDDFLARLGGDEFAIIFLNINERVDAIRLADKLIAAFENNFQLKNHEIACSISIGIADSENIRSPSELLQNVDMALQRVKKSGKNKALYYEKYLDEKQKRALNIESKLNGAIQNSEFYIELQPIINLTDNSLYSLEALIRWHNAELGQIFPDEFIPIAEQSGKITRITNYVIERACELLHTWQQKKLDVVPIYVNVSPSDLIRTDFIKYAANTCKKYHLDRQLLRFELTETAAFLNNEVALSNIVKLTNENFIVSIDDFGTGYSSLSRLTNLPVSALKVDRAFISNIENIGNIKIIESVISIAKTFNLKVTIEGVETDAQLQLSKQKGADLAQGFYLCRPKSHEEITQLYFNKKLEEG